MIESQPVNLQQIKRKIGHLLCNFPVILYLSEIPDTLQQPVCKTGSAAGAPCQLLRTA